MEKTGDAGVFSGEKKPDRPVTYDQDKAAKDSFYEKLGKLNESSGLSSVFNFRESILDLYCFYKEVLKRGGFYQVTKIGKWDDVAAAAASNLKSCVPIAAAQLQNIYEILLLQYELMYCRKMPEAANTWPDKSFLCSGVSLRCSMGKRKHFGGSSPFSLGSSGDPDGPTDKRKRNDSTCQVTPGPVKIHKDLTMITSSNSGNKECMVYDSPVKPRSGYQIFLRLETHRLKMIHGESSNTHSLREMAIDAWRSLPDKDKLPYIEASKMDKERYDKEMATYMQQKDKPSVKSQSLFSNPTSSIINFSASSKTDDVYHVTVEDDRENFHSPDQSMVQLAIEVMKNAHSNDSIFQIDLDSSCLDVP
ncbi:HMG box-containing protein [Handroanthus impetiginosus]|uniref:HMG box-containing protein n=1 Tax=Handroanthus impetiginosus TaxID=429701 RepID=A0A2G9GXP9_9LAMI|nr:HMG box-containing protein [Handroanthus impetiginosus]